MEKLKMPEVFSKINFRKILEPLIIIILVVSLGTNLYLYSKKPVVVTEEKIVKEEVVKYVEQQGGTPTDKIVMHLNSRIDPSTAKLIGKAVDESSKKYSLPRKLVLAIMNKESFFNPLAKSFKDCVGLMQVNPKTHKEKYKGIPKTHLYHIDINVDLGCRIFREYFDASKGDLKEAFHRYLGKKAKKQEIAKYRNDILHTFANLEMYEYLPKKEGKEMIDVKPTIKIPINNNSNVSNDNRVQPETD